MKKTFALMYPGSLNLHGENYSALAFQKACAMVGVNTSVQVVSSFDEPLAEKADIWFFGPGELSTLKLLLPHLQAQKDAIKNHYVKGGKIIALGNSGILFAEKITFLDGSELEGLGLLPMTATERKLIKAEDLIVDIPLCKHPLAGFQVQRFDFHTTSPFGKVIHGWGNNNYDGYEGCVSYNQNLIFTNCLGPLLVKNPWFTQALIGDKSEHPFSDEERAYQALIHYIESKPKSETLL